MLGGATWPRHCDAHGRARLSWLAMRFLMTTLLMQTMRRRRRRRGADPNPRCPRGQLLGRRRLARRDAHRRSPFQLLSTTKLRAQLSNSIVCRMRRASTSGVSSSTRTSSRLALSSQCGPARQRSSPTSTPHQGQESSRRRSRSGRGRSGLSRQARSSPRGSHRAHLPGLLHLAGLERASV